MGFTNFVRMTQDERTHTCYHVQLVLCCPLGQEVVDALDFFGIWPFLVPQDVMLASW